MGLLDHLTGEVSEQAIFRRSSAIIRHAIKANSMLAETVKGDQKACGMAEAIAHEADRETFSIANSITEGGVAPNLIDDMMRFIDTENNIVDNLSTLSRALCRYKIKERPAAEFVNKRLLSAQSLIDESLKLLLKMHEADTVSAVRRLRARVKDNEKRDDQIKEALLDFAYESKVDYKTFYQITTVAYLSDDVMDGCEDAADMILSIMLSILT
ncbi:MAG: DUF47 family protein [Candidatus Micrarchaeota archaeon]|nr:DUF47 family protein [Candidatus Micrarchaeota archaeon]